MRTLYSPESLCVALLALCTFYYVWLYVMLVRVRRKLFLDYNKETSNLSVFRSLTILKQNFKGHQCSEETLYLNKKKSSIIGLKILLSLGKRFVPRFL